MSDIEIPEDIGLKIGTKAQVVWERVLKESKKMVEELEDALLVQKSMITLAEQKIDEEKKYLNT